MGNAVLPNNQEQDMEVILNIGLDSVNGNVGIGTALRQLHNGGFVTLDYAVHYSDTERTLVARCETGGMVETPVRHLATVLGQDCIAVWLPLFQRGELYGPRAAAWGEFNPEFFLQLDGTRLSETALPRAA